MHISPDSIQYWHSGFFKLNATIVNTWIVMAVLVVGARMVTSRLTISTHIPRWQNLLEIVVTAIRTQLHDTGLGDPDRYIGFVGTLFIFIAAANLFSILPGYEPPTGSLSTTAALSISVFIAVPTYGIAANGIGKYLGRYLKPTLLMLPFNVIAELTRTLSLAVRLFGNVMSGTMIIGVLLSIAPLVFPILMLSLGLLTGMVQAYIFSILATVYIAAATRGEAG